jgi:hypothetical protein
LNGLNFREANMLERKATLSTYLGATGAMLGLAAGIFLTILRIVNSEGPQLRAEWVGNLVFSLVYLAPFALSLLALRWSAPWRAGVWGAAAVLGCLGALTAFSGVSLVLLPAALLLAPAALAAYGRISPSRWPATVLIAAMLIGLVAGGWLGLRSGKDAGRCWELVRGPAGETAWQEAPFSQSSSATATAAGEKANIVRVLCTTDVITATEAGVGLLPLILAGALVMGMARRWPASPKRAA